MSFKKSVVILTWKYDEDLRTMTVTFRNNRRYEYYEVPPSMNRAFEDADSFGVFFNECIKPNYKYAEI